MATGRKGGRGSRKPSDEVHLQVLDLLKLAEQSSYPDIRAVALDIAKDKSAQQNVRSSRIPPAIIMVAGTIVLLAAAFSCLYVLVHYPGSIGHWITLVIIFFAVFIVALYTLLSGHLSQENFTKLCISLWSLGKKLLLPAHHGDVLEVTASADGDQSTPGEKSSTET